VPKSADTAYIINGGTAAITLPGAACQYLYLGDPNSTNSGTIQMSGGSLSVSSQERLGNTGAGTFTQSGGTNNIGNFLYLGYNPGSSGTYNLGGSGVLSAWTEYVGCSGAGTFTQSGGTNNVGHLLYLGYNPGSSGTYNLSGSGLVSASTEYVGVGGTGSFTQSGGTNSVAESLSLSGTYNLSGGVLIVPQLTGGGTFNFGGGTLQASNSLSTSQAMTLTGAGNATFDTAGYSVTLSGPLSGPGNLIKAGSGTLTLSAANTYSGNTLISGGTLALADPGALQQSTLDTSGGGVLSFGSLTSATLGGLTGPGALSLTNTASAAVALSVGNNNASTTFSGTLQGGGSLTKTGSGTLTMAGSDTYTGGTTVSGGTLQMGNPSALGSSGVVATGGAGVLDLSGYSLTLGSLTGAGGTILNSSSSTASVLAVNVPSGSSTYGGVLADGPPGGGTLALALSGAGTLILTGNNAYSGGTAVSGGTLQMGNGLSGQDGSLGSGPVANSAALVYNLNGTQTANYAITGPGSLTVASGTLVLTNTGSTYTGGTTISGGTLQVGNGGSAASIGSTSGVLDNGSLVFNHTDSVTFAPVISGSGSLTRMGTGILTLAGSNTYSGGTTISAGTLQVGNGGASGSIVGNVTNNAALVFNRSDNYTSGCTVGGTGQLVQAGAGTLTLTGAISNAVFANAGRIVVGPTGMLNGNLTIAAGARVENDAAALQIANLTNSGTFLGSADLSGNFVNQSSGDVRIAGGQRVYVQATSAQTNSGLVEVLGAQAAAAQFESAGPLTNSGSQSMIAAQNADLYFDGGMTNQGPMAFSYGASEVFGNVNNTSGGTIAVAGSAGVAFYGNVVQNGTLYVSPGSSVVFFGAFSGSGGISGGGDVFFVGDPRPGNSPAAVTIGGNAFMAGSANLDIELMGPLAGSQYDQVNVTGTVALGGTLNVTLPTGYRPSHNTQFEIMTFGSCTGSFATMSGLDLGNRLQLVPTYTDHSLILTAVQGGSGVWNTDANGVISAAGNWANGLPGEAGDTATFGPIISAPRTITVDAPATFGSMIFQSGNSYTLAGSAPITLQAPGGNPQITVLDGGHVISAPLVLAGSLAVSATAGGSLEISGNVSGDGASLALNGGQLILSGSNSYTGGTSVTSGTLEAQNSSAIPSESLLEIDAGGSLVLGQQGAQYVEAFGQISGGPLNSQASGTSGGAMATVVGGSGRIDAVPEPGTLALLAVAAACGLAAAQRRRG
jgi:autotransporter-associated beta strand protein